jgi:hypothetical protein
MQVLSVGKSERQDLAEKATFEGKKTSNSEDHSIFYDRKFRIYQ